MAEGQEKGKATTRRDFLKLGVAAAIPLFVGPIACARREDLEPKIKKTPRPLPTPTPEPTPTPTPISEDLKIKEFSVGTVDFTFDENISFGDQLEIRALYQSAYPFLKDLFGLEPLPMEGKERLKIHLASGEWQEEKKYRVNGDISNFDEEGRRNMYLRDTKEQMINLHELNHLFSNFPLEYDYDPLLEGFAVAAEIIIGEKLGLIDSQDEFILRRLGPLYHLSSFNSQRALAALSYDAYPPMMEIRYLAAGIAWTKMYQEDPEVFIKFHRVLGKHLEGKRKRSIDKMIEEAFSGDFEAFRQENPVLAPPQVGKRVALAPIARGRELIACCFGFDHQVQMEEFALEGVPLMMTIEIDGKAVVENKSLLPTDEWGVVRLFITPEVAGYTNQRIPEELKTSLMRITIRAPFGQQEVEIKTPSLEISTTYLLRPKSRMAA